MTTRPEQPTGRRRLRIALVTLVVLALLVVAVLLLGVGGHGPWRHG